MRLIRSAAFALACLTAAVPVRRSIISILPIHNSIGFYAGDLERALLPTPRFSVAYTF
jgi:hypothetical protein